MNILESKNLSHWNPSIGTSTLELCWNPLLLEHLTWGPSFKTLPFINRTYLGSQESLFLQNKNLTVLAKHRRRKSNAQRFGAFSMRPRRCQELTPPSSKPCGSRKSRVARRFFHFFQKELQQLPTLLVSTQTPNRRLLQHLFSPFRSNRAQPAVLPLRHFDLLQCSGAQAGAALEQPVQRFRMGWGSNVFVIAVFSVLNGIWMDFGWFGTVC